MRQTPENRRAVQEGVQDRLDEKEEKKILSGLPEHEPSALSENLERYSVQMCESKLIKLPPQKTVEIETTGLSACTAVAVFIENREGERFCLLSHFPYYLGGEFDHEMERYDASTMAGAHKKAAIVLPAGSRDNEREERVVREMLEKNGIRYSDIDTYRRVRVDHDSYRQYNGRVNIRWESEKEPSLQYLAEHEGWKEVRVDLDSSEPA